VDFEILDRIYEIETFAVASRISDLRRLRRAYGLGHWRKCKGVARVKLQDGAIRRAELHWYEATGIGRYEFKIKRYLD
jgi:hypothetical protein